MISKLNLSYRIYRHPLFRAVGFSVLYFILSNIVHTDIFRDYDYQLMLFLQKAISTKLDGLFSLLTYTGSGEFTVLLIVSIFLWLLFRKKKLFIGIHLFFSIILIELFGKLMVYHPKPPPFFTRSIVYFRLPSSMFIQTAYSYPSGHIARVFFVLTVLLFLFSNSKIRSNYKTGTYILIFLYMAAMIISRVYLGEHWFSDVVGGILLGSAIANFSLLFW